MVKGERRRGEERGTLNMGVLMYWTSEGKSRRRKEEGRRGTCRHLEVDEMIGEEGGEGRRGGKEGDAGREGGGGKNV